MSINKLLLLLFLRLIYIQKRLMRQLSIHSHNFQNLSRSRAKPIPHKKLLLVHPLTLANIPPQALKHLDSQFVQRLQVSGVSQLLQRQWLRERESQLTLLAPSELKQQIVDLIVQQENKPKLIFISMPAQLKKRTIISLQTTEHVFRLRPLQASFEISLYAPSIVPCSTDMNLSLSAHQTPQHQAAAQEHSEEEGGEREGVEGGEREGGCAEERETGGVSLRSKPNQKKKTYFNYYKQKVELKLDNSQSLVKYYDTSRTVSLIYVLSTRPLAFSHSDIPILHITALQQLTSLVPGTFLVLHQQFQQSVFSSRFLRRHKKLISYVLMSRETKALNDLFYSTANLYLISNSKRRVEQFIKALEKGRRPERRMTSLQSIQI